ncbi:hypothetical protein HDU76_012716, partial [Blyttiomyces sp. JEL0837]
MSTASTGGANSGLATFLTNELTALTNEAKRKNPDVKEACERLQIILKKLKEIAPTFSPAGVDFVAEELSKSDDALRPFLLACSAQNPKLAPIAIGSLQRLATHHAVPENSVSSVLKALSDQISAPMELQLKILQTVVPLMTNYVNLHGEAVAEALVLCFKLQDTKSPIVNGTASATLRQLIIHTFEKVVIEDSKLAAEGASFGTDEQRNSGVLLPSVRDAYLVFQDLCQLTNGEPPNFLKIPSMSKTLGLELIDSVIASHPKLFIEHMELMTLLKERVCPLVIKSFSERNDFSMTSRLLRVMYVIIKNFNDQLVMECEICLSMLIKLLEPDTAAAWQRALVLEVIRNLCSTEGFLRTMFSAYDAKEHSTKLFMELINAIARIVVVERPSVLLSPPQMVAESPASGSPPTLLSEWTLTVTGCSLRLQCIDQLDKSDPPAFPELYITYLAVQCINLISENQANYILPRLSHPAYATSESTDS